MSILDLLKEVPLSAVLKEKISGLESENQSLHSEISVLQEKLEQSEQQRRALEKQIVEINHGNPDGYACDHCGSQSIRRTGNRLDPYFGDLGVKQKIFTCNECGKESGFTPSA